MIRLTLLHKIIFVFVLFALGLIVSFVLIDSVIMSSHIRSVALKNGVAKSLEREMMFKAFLADAEGSLQALAKDRPFEAFLAEPTPERREAAEAAFLTMSRAEAAFMQLRYIDAEGMERLRIDRSWQGAAPFAVAPEALQDKSHRDYFTGARDAGDAGVRFSALDLNVEHHRVEIPYRPTIRAALPLYRAGRFRGIVIINYFLQPFLDIFFDTPLYDTALRDGEGYFLHHYDPALSWSRYADEPVRQDDVVTRMDTGTLEYDGAVARRLDLPLPQTLILVLKPKQTYLDEQNRLRMSQYLLEALIIIFLALILSLFVARIVRRLSADVDRVSHIVNNVLSSIYVYDFDQARVTFVNPQFTAVTGYTLEQISALSPEAYDDLVHPMDREALADHRRIVAQGTAVRDLRFRLRHHAGHWIWCHAHDLILDRHADGMPRSMLGSFIDVSESARQEQLLIQQSKMAAMGEMIAAIAHQWRQPLAAVGGILINLEDDLLYGTLDKTRTIDRFETAQQHLQSMSSTIDDFSTFFEPSRQSLPFCLAQATLKAIAIVHPQLQDAGIVVQLHVTTGHERHTIARFDAGATLPEVLQKGHPNEYVQVIINLLTNAKEAFRASGRAEGGVAVYITETARQVIVKVADDAGGIAASIIDRVFEPYFSTKGAGSGSGIGLYMSKMIVEKSMNGTITVENGDNGAIFTLTFDRMTEDGTRDDPAML